MNEAANGLNLNSTLYATTEESCQNTYGAKSALKNKTVKKFDAYYFFKNEFALQKQDIDEEELEKVKIFLTFLDLPKRMEFT